MRDREPRDWRYVGRAGREPPNAVVAWLGSVASAVGRVIGGLVRWLGAALPPAAAGLARLVFGEGRGRRIGPVEALVWLTVAVVVGAFLLLLSQHALPLAVALGALGVIWAIREMR